MSIEKLTTLLELLRDDAPAPTPTDHPAPTPTDHPAAQMIGKFVIIRSRDSGVHAGTLVSVQDRTVRLTGSRRLWHWKAAKGHTLSGVALHGLAASGSKIAGEVSEICILDACEILPTTAAAGQSILGEPEYEPS